MLYNKILRYVNNIYIDHFSNIFYIKNSLMQYYYIKKRGQYNKNIIVLVPIDTFNNIY